MLAPPCVRRNLARVDCVACPFAPGLLLCGQSGGGENLVQQALGTYSFAARSEGLSPVCDPVQEVMNGG